MEQIVMGALVLAVVVGIRRKEMFTFRWHPDRGTWIAVGAGLLAFLLSAVVLSLGPGTLLARLVLYGGIWLGCGVVIPWGTTLRLERSSVASLGLRRQGWLRSLLIGLGLAACFSLVIVAQVDVPSLDWAQVGRAAVVLVGAGGLFELFLYYGFIHLRLARAFGPLPAIVLTAGLYVLWHVGTQLPMEADPWLGALKLLGVGVMYQAVFSLTYNLLIIWPFFLGVGVMIDFLVNIGELGMISAAFPWAVVTLLLMALVMGAMLAASRRRQGATQAGTAWSHAPSPRLGS